MKIAIGYKVKSGSWGGGNQFVNSLIKAAIDEGHEVIFNLNDKNIDLILLIDPRSYNEEISFGSFEIIRYLLFVNKKAIVIHRINECDERKRTFHVNRLLRWSNYCADHTVFIASWLKELNIYDKRIPNSVILNGADATIFKDHGNSYWDNKKPLKIVTHHWSANYMKGFDVYKNLDNILSSPEWKDRIQFTYIGNLPDGFTFKKSKHISPINGKRLGIELSKNHLYISASINEPAGMHHIEGILCGLPIIFRDSGALPEYCNSYGISFKDGNYLPALRKIMENYEFYKKNVSKYPNNSDRMTRNYLALFSFLLKNRDEIVKNRNLFRSSFLILMNFLIFLIKSRNIVKLVNKICKKKFHAF